MLSTETTGATVAKCAFQFSLRVGHNTFSRSFFFVVHGLDCGTAPQGVTGEPPRIRDDRGWVVSKPSQEIDSEVQSQSETD